MISSAPYPMSYDSILKAPANFRDSALYSNDPTDPMFTYNVPQHLADRNIDQHQNPHNHFDQPSYTNIPGNWNLDIE